MCYPKQTKTCKITTPASIQSIVSALDKTPLTKIRRRDDTTYILYFDRKIRVSRILALVPDVSSAVGSHAKNETEEETKELVVWTLQERASWSATESVNLNIYKRGKKIAITTSSVLQSIVSPLLKTSLIKIRKVDETTYVLYFDKKERVSRVLALLPDSRNVVLPRGNEDNDDTTIIWTRGEAHCCWDSITKPYADQRSLYNALDDAPASVARSGPICIARDKGDVNKPFAKVYIGYKCVQPAPHSCTDDSLAIEMATDNRNAYEILRRDSNDDRVPFRPYMDIEWENDVHPQLNDPTAVLKTIIDRLDSFYMKEVNPDVAHCFTKETRTQLLVSSRPKKNRDGVVVGMKHSYHMTFVDLAFWTMADCKFFIRAFLEYLCRLSQDGDDAANALSFVDTSHKRMTRASYKFVVDSAVYTKNRLMRMEGQSKYGSDVVLTRVPDCYEITKRPYDESCVLQPTEWQRTGLPSSVSGIDVTNLKKAYGRIQPQPHPYSRTHEEYARVHAAPSSSVLTDVENTGEERYDDHSDGSNYLPTGDAEGNDELTHTLCPLYEVDQHGVINTHEDILKFLPGRDLRHEDFNAYYASLVSIVKSEVFTRERVIEWCDRGDERRSQADYNAALKKKREPGPLLNYPTKLVMARNPQLRDNRRLNEGRGGTWRVAWNKLLSKEWPSMDSTTVIDELHQRLVAGDGRHTVIGVRGAMGTGKTHNMLEAIAAAKLRAVVYVVGRRRLAIEITDRCRANASIEAVKVYTEGTSFGTHLLYGRDTVGDLADENWGYTLHDDAECELSVLQESRAGPMHRIPDVQVDALVIDEAETTVANLYSPSLMGSRGHAIATAFMDVLDRAPVVISIDAEHSDPLYEALYDRVASVTKVLHNCLEDVPNRMLVTMAQREGHHGIFSAVELCGPPTTKQDFANDCANDSIVAAILEQVVVRKQRVAISTVHKTRVDTLYNALMAEHVRVNGRALRIETITGTDKIPVDMSVDELAANADVVIFNTALSAGHSIELGQRFACVFALFTFDRYGTSTAPINEQVQMTGRVRSCRDKKLYYSVEMINGGRAPSHGTQRECYHEAFRPHFEALATSERVLKQAHKTDILSYVAHAIERAYPYAISSRRAATKLLDLVELGGLRSRMRTFNKQLIQIYSSTSDPKLRRLIFRDSPKLNRQQQLAHVRPAITRLVGSEEAIDKLRLACPVPFDLVPVDVTHKRPAVVCPSNSLENESESQQTHPTPTKKKRQAD